MGIFKSNNPFRHAGQSSNVDDDVAPPPGPPPSHQQQDYAPPPGPPPSHGSQDYAPPPGPPPSHGSQDYAPPPGPPPSYNTTTNTQGQQNHAWQSVPDTALFPPPPDIFSGFTRSTATNATEEQSEAGEAWCARYPLTLPMNLADPAIYRQVAAARFPQLIQPPTNTFRGMLRPNNNTPGIWTLKTEKSAGDACVIGYPPLYIVERDNPLNSNATTAKKTIYYECVLSRHHRENLDTGEIGLALGFTALPYPPFRMPGWHRGSLAVHGDDGHKYINDRWGGKSFTEPFRRGETVGLGMTFSRNGGRIETEVFFTRDGRLDGRWDLHEESDAEQDLPVTGLEGYHDLVVAVGTFSMVGVEVVLDPARWAYKGLQI